jgi:PTH1 family peptidyl-tRNA hydrolase
VVSRLFSDIFSKRRTQPNSDDKFLIVGLGNPGAEHIGSRHNIGSACAYTISRKYGFKFSAESYAEFGTGLISGCQIFIICPTTYMNNSGIAIDYYHKKFSVHPKNIIVISDDINLRIGNVRVRSSGGDGGHNGIKSVIRSLGTEDFSRIRIGVGSPKDRHDQINYVLSKIPPDQKCFLDAGIKHSVKAAELIIHSGIETAMNKINGK